MKWYAVRAATRQEERAFKALAALGFSTYLPVEVRWKNKERKHRPLFDGYLFVACEEEFFSVILDTDYVHQFVRYYNRSGILVPMPIPVSELRKVFIAEQGGEFDYAKPKAAYRPEAKDRVKVTGGKWASQGYIGTILAMKASDRQAVVSLDGSWAKIDVDVEHLEELA